MTVEEILLLRYG